MQAITFTDRRFLFGKKTTPVVIEHIEDEYTTRREVERRIESLHILMGHYNRYGRNIPLDDPRYNDAMAKFHEALNDMDALLTEFGSQKPA